MSTIPIMIDGRTVELNEEQIVHLIKQKIRNSKSIQNMFIEFEVSPDRLDELQFVITPLDHKYAETDINTMKLNTSMFSSGDFFEKYFFVIAHEIVHWLSRIKENDAYFNDPEEVLGFVSSIAYELEQNSDLNVAWNKVYPKISWHFSNESDAKEFFENMIEKAKSFL